MPAGGSHRRQEAALTDDARQAPRRDRPRSRGARAAALSLFGSRWFYGWTILAVAGVGLFASGPGQSHTFSVFVGPLSRDLSLSSAAVAVAYGAATLAASSCLPLVGRLVDRLGTRVMATLVVGLLGLACAGFSAVQGLASLALGFAALRLFGQGSLMLCCAALVSQWFTRRRGFAMSLMALGFALSMGVHPPLAQALESALGWRQAWLVLGALTWVLMLPPLLLLVHDRPEDVGLAPDGEGVPGGGAPGVRPDALTGLTLRQALATPAFYILTAGWFTVAMLVTTLHFYQVSILRGQGVPAEVAARLFAISAVTMVITMPLVGRLFDRLRTRRVVATALLVLAAALVGVTLAREVVSAVLYAVLFGLTNAFSMTMFGFLWPRYFGRRYVGSIQGTGQMVGVAGASLGPLPVGLAFDLVGSPAGTLRLLALVPLACAVATMWLRTPAGVTGSEHLE
ncbi:MAG TPA: MFS transporter [Candidatus Binatia bacterium]|nr:MFS transporter [Candidatus Binatia bacterium]